MSAKVTGGYGIRVLMVDDQQVMADSVRELLASEEDITFRHCSNPRRALQVARDFSPTVILQDMVMPEMGGLELARLFKNHPVLSEIPLVMLSSRVEAVTKADAFANGADDYLVKFPEKIELIARIRYHSRNYINLLQKKEIHEALEESQKALNSEISRAAAYVLSLMPPVIQEGAVTTEWCYHPSTSLGGDSLGYHWIDEEHFAIYLLDVSGHGIGAALLSVSALNVIRSQALPATDFLSPSSVLSSLNETFQMEKHDNLYFTIWYGVYSTAGSRLCFAGAGHPHPLLFQKDGVVEQLSSQNTFIGLKQGERYMSREVQVKRPARLIVFSDGVYEIGRPDGSCWTYNDFKELLSAPAREGDADLETLYSLVRDMHDRPALEDDFSIMRVTFS